MKILVIGSGGREHALVWKIAQSPLVQKIYCAPGNPGIAGVAQCVPGDPCDPAVVTELARTVDAQRLRATGLLHLDRAIAARRAEALSEGGAA